MVDEGLSDEELSSVKKLAFSTDRFEPFPSALIAPRTLDRLMEGWRIARERWTVPRAPTVVERRSAFH